MRHDSTPSDSAPASGNFEPLLQRDRNSNLDVLRGIALFGVLWVNLLTDFRISLFKHLFNFHTHAGAMNEWIDLVTAWLFEFKAFTVFSFLFGVGICVQSERATSHEIPVARFMGRRFVALLAIGLCHMFLIWDGDILCLYAICGLLIIPLIELPALLLIPLSIVAMALSFTPLAGFLNPSDRAMQRLAVTSAPIYAYGTYSEILHLRWKEAWHFIGPLEVNALPKTVGLMLLGIVAWRSGILRQPVNHRRFITAFFISATAVGATVTSLQFWAAINDRSLPVPSGVSDGLSYIPLALGLTAGLTLGFSYVRTGWVVGLLKAAGQMALTNYLAQSLIFSFIFYSYGLQLFDQLAPAPTAVIGLAVFAAQLVLSRVWLKNFRFGPMEWLWRTMTYGRRQRMKRIA